MAVSRITDEADLGSFADFLGNEITAIFLSKEKFKAYDINIVNFSVQFLKSNAENELPVTRDDIEFYWWLAVRKVFKTGDPDQDRLLQQARTSGSPWVWPQVNSYLDKMPLLSGTHGQRLSLTPAKPR